ncbi:MAG TPA: hypothetical protein EYQ50_06325 [Verrucomicrobiales bacterium]|nr:hypothetical protein [Verrucomicrobiales bacterium]HIL68297.1 hypothetical protein [Verrucomicrobiota bacterium]
METRSFTDSVNQPSGLKLAVKDKHNHIGRCVAAAARDSIAIRSRCLALRSDISSHTQDLDVIGGKPSVNLLLHMVQIVFDSLKYFDLLHVDNSHSPFSDPGGFKAGMAAHLLVKDAFLIFKP